MKQTGSDRRWLHRRTLPVVNITITIAWSPTLTFLGRMRYNSRSFPESYLQHREHEQNQKPLPGRNDTAGKINFPE